MNTLHISKLMRKNKNDFSVVLLLSKKKLNTKWWEGGLSPLNPPVLCYYIIIIKYRYCYKKDVFFKEFQNRIVGFFLKEENEIVGLFTECIFLDSKIESSLNDLLKLKPSFLKRTFSLVNILKDHFMESHCLQLSFLYYRSR